jgi:hypothetical protein
MTATDRAAAGHERDDREKLRQKLLGAWSLVSYIATSADGEVIHPLGPAPSGLLIYTPQGYMSAQLGRGDRPPMKPARLEDAAADELAQAAVGYVAYGGPFEVVDAATVEHHVTISLFPNWTGHPQVRKVSFAGPQLTLATPAPTRLWGAERTAELTWSRLA